MGSIFIYMYIKIAIFIHNITSYHNSAREKLFVVTQVLSIFPQYSGNCVLSKKLFQYFWSPLFSSILVTVILEIKKTNKLKLPWQVTVVLYNSLFRAISDCQARSLECINTPWE